jgi:O-antigen biosynthesis protein
VILNYALSEDFSLAAKKPKRVAIVGLKKESQRVTELLGQTGIKTHIVGYISTQNNPHSERYLGSLSQISEMVRVHQIDELIFCSVGCFVADGNTNHARAFELQP